MDEVIRIIESNSPDGTSKGDAVRGGEEQTKAPVKPGRKSNFTTPKDLTIAQEVAAAEAHVAPYGKTLYRFEQAAEKANSNPNFDHTVTGKNIQDRFKTLLEDFSTCDLKYKVMSGVDGEIEELDDLLGDILEAKKSLDA